MSRDFKIWAHLESDQESLQCECNVLPLNYAPNKLQYKKNTPRCLSKRIFIIAILPLRQPQLTSFATLRHPLSLILLLQLSERHLLNP